MRVSQVGGWIFWKHNGVWVFGSLAGEGERSALLLPQAEEGGATVPAQAQSDTLGCWGAESVHKVMGKGAPSLIDVHNTEIVCPNENFTQGVHSLVKKYSHQMQFFLVSPKKRPV